MDLLAANPSWLLPGVFFAPPKAQKILKKLYFSLFEWGDPPHQLLYMFSS